RRDVTFAGLLRVLVVTVSIHRLRCWSGRDYRLNRHDQEIAQSFADEMRAGRILIDGRRWRRCVPSHLGRGERRSGSDDRNGKPKYALTHEMCFPGLIAG